MCSDFVPDELKEMNTRIDQIFEILRIQNGMICQLLPQSVKLRACVNELTSFESKLDAIDDSILAIKELVKLKRPLKIGK